MYLGENEWDAWRASFALLCGVESGLVMSNLGGSIIIIRVGGDTGSS